MEPRMRDRFENGLRTILPFETKAPEAAVRALVT
jgi:hypothetical protein